MFRKLYNGGKSKLHTVKIGGIDVESLSLFLYSDYEFEFPALIEEYDEIFIPGRDGSYTRHIRYLNREFTIDFNVKDVSNYPKFMEKLITTLNNSIGKLVTLNNETIGLKIQKYKIDSNIRGYGSNQISITFVCQPFQYDENGKEYKF